MFKDLVESSGRRGSRSQSSLLVSCGVHGVFVLILLLVPLLHYQTLPAQILTYLPLTKPGPPPPLPPPPPAARKELVLKGGEVMASKLIRRIAPVYPELAKRVRVQGPVHPQLRIDELGNVAEIRIISGHPLLVDTAVNAVSQWKYSPTFLNGEPDPVIATVTVNFVLN